MSTATATQRQPRRTGGKSSAAFRTISEVAAEIEVPQHVLRFWETRFNQVRPIKGPGGRRYYRPDDVVLLRRIRDLLYTRGYTIKGVQKLLRGGMPDEAPSAPADAPAPRPASATKAAASPPPAALSPQLRAEIKALLADLEDLRKFLRDV
ncbi:MAG: MerR family transcriptional regulator [Rhodospirillaceae bacterium]|nr:MerR family transcriptional regulator [Rhodospirillaceae bacterium]